MKVGEADLDIGRIGFATSSAETFIADQDQGKDGDEEGDEDEDGIGGEDRDKDENEGEGENGDAGRAMSEAGSMEGFDGALTRVSDDATSSHSRATQMQKYTPNMLPFWGCMVPMAQTTRIHVCLI